jgi:hypothetical protein
MSDSSTNKDKNKTAKNDHCTPEQSIIMEKLLKPISVILKWITKGAKKVPICSS